MASRSVSGTDRREQRAAGRVLVLNATYEPITRRAVFARDSWTCQYCGSRSNLTVDHVIPRSKGGGSDWENIVAACAPCNRRKGDMTPIQANMIPAKEPRAPHPQVFIHVASPTIPATWKQWLPEAA